MVSNVVDCGDAGTLEVHREAKSSSHNGVPHRGCNPSHSPPNNVLALPQTSQSHPI